MRARAIKFIILVAFVAGAFIAIRAAGLGAYLDQARLRTWIEGFGVWGPLVYMLVYAVAPSLMFPGIPLTVVGGVLFGPVLGSVYVLFGATAGAVVAFLIARYLGRDLISGLIARRGSQRLKELDERVARHGWKIVAVTRLVPLFPYNFLNYAYGLTKVRFIHYALATFVFMIPGVVAYVVFSSSLLDVLGGRVSTEFVIGVVLVAAVSALPFLYRRFKNRGAGGRR